jgi:hypothetical protein
MLKLYKTKTIIIKMQTFFLTLKYVNIYSIYSFVNTHHHRHHLSSQHPPPSPPPLQTSSITLAPIVDC